MGFDFQWLLAALLLAILSPVTASPRQDGGGFFRSEPAAHHKDDVHYKYQYAVDDPVSGVVNDRWEQRSGDFVKGAYSLLDPDGRVRTVDYEVDGERGFHAVIRTQYPGTSLLSIQSASRVQQVYEDPPVNLRARAGLDVPEFARRNPRFSTPEDPQGQGAHGLPFNYHALDAAKLGLLDLDGPLEGVLSSEDGDELQRLTASASTPRQEYRRKYQDHQEYHPDNHLLPQDRVHQQHSLPVQRYAGQPRPVFNPRAEYINLHPPASQRSRDRQPSPGLSELPTALNPRGRPLPSPSDSRPASPASRYRSAPAVFQHPQLPQLHTLALVVPSGAAPGRTATRRSPSQRSRIVQHLTETSPGVSSSSSYFL